jgi:hypothetical protein
VKIKSSISEAL